jgi:hypothetical protein
VELSSEAVNSGSPATYLRLGRFDGRREELVSISFSITANRLVSEL